MVSHIRAVSVCFSFPWFIVLSVWVSMGYAKYVLTPVHPVEFPQKNQFPKKPGFPLSTLIILDWYDSYVSLFPDLLCNIGLSVSGLRKMRFNTYTPRRISTKNQFPKKPRFPLSTLIILVRNNVDLLFKTESGKIRIISNNVYLAIPKPATITCRDKKKLRS